MPHDGASEAPIEIAGEQLNLGEVPHSPASRHQIQVKILASQPIEIRGMGSASASLKFDWPQTPLQPSRIATLDVTIDALALCHASAPGEVVPFETSFWIATRSSIQWFRLSGKIRGLARVLPNRIALSPPVADHAADVATEVLIETVAGCVLTHITYPQGVVEAELRPLAEQPPLYALEVRALPRPDGRACYGAIEAHGRRAERPFTVRIPFEITRSDESTSIPTRSIEASRVPSDM